MSKPRMKLTDTQTKVSNQELAGAPDPYGGANGLPGVPDPTGPNGALNYAAQLAGGPMWPGAGGNTGQLTGAPDAYSASYQNNLPGAPDAFVGFQPSGAPDFAVLPTQRPPDAQQEYQEPEPLQIRPPEQVHRFEPFWM